MKTILKNYGFFLVSVSLTACSVGPDYTLPSFELPESWLNSPQETAPQAAAKEWWKNFNDPILDELIVKAKAQNLDLKQAQSRVKEARALANGANAELLPLISIGGGASKGSKNGNNINSELFEVGFDAIWEADIFGGNRRFAEAAGAEFEAAEAELDDVMLSLIAEVTRNYIEVRLYQQQLQLAKQTLETQTSTARITDARYKEGVEGKLEVARSGAQLNSTKAQVPLFENLIGASTYRLEFLLGGKPGSLKAQLGKAKPVPLIEPLIATDTPVNVIARRPDVKIAERRLASATALQGAAIADMYPKLSLSAILGLQSGDAGKLFRSSNKIWSVGGNFIAPLFDFGRVRANIDASDARQEQAMAAYQANILAALNDVETTLLAYAKESERNEFLSEAVENSKNALRISQLQYKEGIISQVDVLEAQQIMYEAEVALAQSSANVSYNLVALYKALAL